MKKRILKPGESMKGEYLNYQGELNKIRARKKKDKIVDTLRAKQGPMFINKGGGI